MNFRRPTVLHEVVETGADLRIQRRAQSTANDAIIVHVDTETCKGCLERSDLPEQDSERVHIHGAVVGLLQCHLGCHVSETARVATHLVQIIVHFLLGSNFLRQSEV